MEARVAVLGFLEVRTGQCVQVGQLVEWHRRIGVVLGVVGHVPGKLADNPAREGRARVREHVRHKRAASVFGQEIEPRLGYCEVGAFFGIQYPARNPQFSKDFRRDGEIAHVQAGAGIGRRS